MPERPLNFYRQAVALSKTDRASSQKLLDKAIGLAPLFPSLYLRKAINFEMDGKDAEAIKAATKALSLDPDSVGALAVRMRCYIHSNKVDLALQDSERRLKINPTYANTYFWRASIFERLHQKRQAEDTYTKALEMTPKLHDKLYASRGNLYLLDGRYELAADDFTKALQLNPKLVGPAAEARSSFSACGAVRKGATRFGSRTQEWHQLC